MEELFGGKCKTAWLFWQNVLTFRASGFFCAGAESFRVPRQTDEEQGTLTKITGTLRSYYDSAVNTASGYMDKIKGLKVEEKAK